MKKLNLLFIALFAVALFTTSCREETTAEESMEEVSDDMEDAADEMEDRAEEIEEAAEEMEDN